MLHLGTRVSSLVTDYRLRERMRHVGRALTAAGVGAIYLVHGTFAGTDALGLIRGITRLSPGARRPLERQAKRLADAAFGEAGNYAHQYAANFEESINHPDCGTPRIPVRLFHWTSENHHVGRADAARGRAPLAPGLRDRRRPEWRVKLWGCGGRAL